MTFHLTILAFLSVLLVVAGVMALHFHPDFANLLAVGCYDGRVLVFDVQAPGSQPLYASSTKTGKHNDPVWQVHWQVSPIVFLLHFMTCHSKKCHRPPHLKVYSSQSTAKWDKVHGSGNSQCF